MAVSLSSLTSSLSSLSFSSNISRKPTSIFLPKTTTFSRSPKFPSFTVTATTADIALAEPEIADLKKYVKSRLPGGFAAQTVIATGRRKTAVARVVLQEGTGKIIINYRDAKCQIHVIQFNFITSTVLNFLTLNRIDFPCWNYLVA
ncbi:30S ribosomal protein S9, chloroplastic [Trifolium repens]|nr:30S ribosomal protein S9, chloroplastic [Trifolium repens]